MARSKAPNKEHVAALEKALQCLTGPVLPEGFGGPNDAAGLLRWFRERAVKIELQDPRNAQQRALWALADKIDETVKVIREALDEQAKG